MKRLRAAKPCYQFQPSSAVPVSASRLPAKVRKYPVVLRKMSRTEGNTPLTNSFYRHGSSRSPKHRYSPPFASPVKGGELRRGLCAPHRKKVLPSILTPKPFACHNLRPENWACDYARLPPCFVAVYYCTQCRLAWQTCATKRLRLFSAWVCRFQWRCQRRLHRRSSSFRSASGADGSTRRCR